MLWWDHHFLTDLDLFAASQWLCAWHQCAFKPWGRVDPRRCAIAGPFPIRGVSSQGMLPALVLVHAVAWLPTQPTNVDTTAASPAACCRVEVKANLELVWGLVEQASREAPGLAALPGRVAFAAFASFGLAALVPVWGVALVSALGVALALAMA